MGKEEGEGQQQREQPTPAEGGAGGSGGGGRGRGGRSSGGCCGAVRPQCAAALVLGAAVALSALFLLPPFLGRGGRAAARDPGAAFAEYEGELIHVEPIFTPESPSVGEVANFELAPEGPGSCDTQADIVASFMLQKTVSELSESTSKLEFDIYEEVGIPNSTVAINFLQPLGASNWTYVIFTIVPYPVHSTISSTWLSILRSSFMSLVVEQSTLHLTDLFRF